MDPTEALKELRSRVFYAQANKESGLVFPDNDPEENLARIVELFQALDTWLTRGGFMPAQWTSPPRAGW
ncbi:UNVERIFIED_ORG: hypothetical protein ABID57_000723 [Arthrobacter sp. UYEF1]